MSRIGKKPIEIPSGVKIEVSGRDVTVAGPKGSLTQAVVPGVKIEVNGNELLVLSENQSRKARSFQGLTRSLLANMVLGVSEGIKKVLEISGLGYKAELDGNTLVLNVGYSHAVRFALPEGIAASIEKNTIVTLSGIDKQKVGQVAANIRSIRRPEPYKGKGIRYAGEKIKRKAGKAGA
jgi:large subunit ribosomal protein L6